MQERQWRVGRGGNCHPDFGRIEGATRQWRSAKLLLPTQFRQLLRPLNYNVLQLYHKALRVTLLQGLLAEHTSGERDRERDLIHLYNEVEEKVCFQTLQTNVVRERGICQTLTDGRCTRYAKTAQIVNMKAFCILHEFI